MNIRDEPVSLSTFAIKGTQPMATSKNKGLKRPPTLTDEVARLLTKNIKDGVYGPGEKLPTETKLCEIYGISRPVLREAISQLKFDGLVVPQQGRGVFVSEKGFSTRLRLDTPKLDDKNETLEVLDLLLAVEVSATSLAAKNRTSVQLKAIEKALQDLIQVISDGGLGSEEDVRFHAEIVKASNNRFFVKLSQFFEENIRYAIRRARKNSSRFEGLSLEVIEEHKAIFKAISEQNIDMAREAAEFHLRKATARLKL